MTRKIAFALFVVLFLALIAALLFERRTPVEGGIWTGNHLLVTTTPSVTLLPGTGWWDELPTPVGPSYSTATPTP